MGQLRYPARGELGTITHEITHTFGIGDNNNNPYVEPYHRTGTRPFDVLDRGSFNGPGGPHNRWQVPATQGASMPAGQTVRTKTKLGFLDDDQLLTLSPQALADHGLAVFDVRARSAKVKRNQLQGVEIDLGRTRPRHATTIRIRSAPAPASPTTPSRRCSGSARTPSRPITG
ncbi:hypothetical protein ACGFYM_26795 [Streptomyces sp. NPDC048231]|uniref:hypothetical protein n=1 Tax=Streptomyces sp. NPDC048231 TaxID=3365519 RepID=UPI003715A1E4